VCIYIYISRLTNPYAAKVANLYGSARKVIKVVAKPASVSVSFYVFWQARDWALLRPEGFIN